MKREDAIKRLRELIAIELDRCDKYDFPYICHMAGDPKSRRNLEDDIIKQCSISGCSVQEAISRLERAYNPNRIED